MGDAEIEARRMMARCVGRGTPRQVAKDGFAIVRRRMTVAAEMAGPAVTPAPMREQRVTPMGGREAADYGPS